MAKKSNTPAILSDTEWARNWWDNEDELFDYIKEKAEDEKGKFAGSQNRKFVQTVARDSLFTAELDKVLKRLQGKVVPSKFSLKKHKAPTERFLNLFLSDTHYGSALDSREVPVAYGPHEEARRTAGVILQTVEYKNDDRRKHTELNIMLGGDMIQGQLHDARDGAPLAWQIGSAISYLTDAISFAKDHFKKVNVYCTSGNHGRRKERHQERATNQKWDSNETAIYLGVKNAFTNVPNVEVHIPLTPYFSVQVFDKKIFGTHGDTVLNPGYPGKSINVKALEHQINAINAALPDKQEYNLFIMGHVHIGAFVQLANGSQIITNAPLVPSDGYGVSIGAFEVTCGATLFESVPGYVVGDYRLIRVDTNTDKDASLEKIVKPFLAL